MTFDELEEFTKQHWRRITFCKECIHYKKIPHCPSYGCDLDSIFGIPLKRDPDFWCSNGNDGHSGSEK